MSAEWTSEGPECTAALGAALAELLHPGDLVTLRGDLGAGKSTLVRAIAAALGVQDPVTSPTFTVMQRHSGDVPVLHMDAYRLDDDEGEEAEMLLEALADGAVGLVEWPRAVAGSLPEPRVAVALEHAGGDRRLVRLAAADAATAAALAAICDHLRARHRHREPERGPRPR